MIRLGRFICRWSIMLFVLSFSAVTVVASPALAQSRSYVNVKLPKGVSISLPRNWIVISENQRITLDASVTARMDNAGLVADFSSDLVFAANYYDDDDKAAGMFNIRYYPAQTVTQVDSVTASSADLLELDAGLRQGIQVSLNESGSTLLMWLGTSKQTVNGLVTFVSEYRRLSPNGVFRVRLVRVLNAGRSFTVTVSYREDQAFLLQPIIEYVTRSLRG